MDDRTTPEEQGKLMAVCMLDGEGEQWQRLAAAINNAAVLIARSNGLNLDASHDKDAGQMEYYRQLNPTDEAPVEPFDWGAAEMMLKGMAGF